MSRAVVSSKKKPDAPSSHSHELLIQLSRVALLEITQPDTFSDQPEVSKAEGVATVSFPCTLAGYPGWSWTIALSDVADLVPTVLELELLPGEGALLPPDWVPWADRMEEYLIHEKELADAVALDDDDDDHDDFDDDVDGVDIDQLDLELDPAPLEVPDEPNDVFDHVDFDEEDPLDP
jgi:hypothetical protein